MSDSNSQISEGRQLLYYGGMGLSVIGALMFVSVFFSGLGSGSSSPSRTVWVSPGSGTIPPGIFPEGTNVRRGSPPSRNFGAPPPEFQRAFWGMGFIVVGGIMMSIGSAGLRGSGVILDPHGAREDLKPWNQAAGGMLDDTLAASPIVTRAVENLGSKSDAEPQIRVRCQGCRALNDEDAKFCDECGAKL